MVLVRKVGGEAEVLQSVTRPFLVSVHQPVPDATTRQCGRDRWAQRVCSVVWRRRRVTMAAVAVRVAMVSAHRLIPLAAVVGVAAAEGVGAVVRVLLVCHGLPGQYLPEVAGRTPQAGSDMERVVPVPALQMPQAAAARTGQSGLNGEVADYEA